MNASDAYAVWANMLFVRLGDVNESCLTHVFPDLARHMEQLMSVQIDNSM